MWLKSSYIIIIFVIFTSYICLIQSAHVKNTLNQLIDEYSIVSRGMTTRKYVSENTYLKAISDKNVVLSAENGNMLFFQNFSKISSLDQLGWNIET